MPLATVREIELFYEACSRAECAAGLEVLGRELAGVEDQFLEASLVKRFFERYHHQLMVELGARSLVDRSAAAQFVGTLGIGKSRRRASPALEAYLVLEAEYLRLAEDDLTDEARADAFSDALDGIWGLLGEEEHQQLDDRTDHEIEAGKASPESPERA